MSSLGAVALRGHRASAVFGREIRRLRVLLAHMAKTTAKPGKATSRKAGKRAEPRAASGQQLTDRRRSPPRRTSRPGGKPADRTHGTIRRTVCAPVILEEIYLAGGCLWGVQEFVRHLPGVVRTEAGRANGSGNETSGAYDGYAECVRTRFDPKRVTVTELTGFFFEIIDPHSLNRQGKDVGEKYRTGVYSRNPDHLRQARDAIAKRADRAKVVVEVLPLRHYVRSAEEHQDRLTKNPGDYCHIPGELLHKYRIVAGQRPDPQ